MPARTERLSFSGSLGETLAARLDLPSGKPRAYAIFAHCFTCSKETHAASRVAGGVPEEIAGKIIEIAGKCPVHRTLESGSAVATKITAS